MDEILQRLRIVAEKATKLEQKYSVLKKEKKALAAKVKKLESSLSGKVEEQSTLKESLNGLGERSRRLNPDDKEALRAQIDAFIEDIDACLKSLGE